MRRVQIALLMLLMPWFGCVRAGFDPSRPGQGAADGPPAADGLGGGGDSAEDDAGGTASYVVSAQHDTCANPLEIDLSPLSRGESITISVDPAGTTGDYGACVAEAVVRLVNIPTGGEVETRCVGGGEFALWSGNAGLCPDTNDQFVSVNCDIVPIGINLSPDPLHLFVCRDPVQGPMTWILAPN